MTASAATAPGAPTPAFPKRPRPDSDPDLKAGLKWSIVGHGAIIAFVLFKTLVFPSHYVPYIPALRVDVVALPDLLKKDIHAVSKGSSSKEILDAIKNAEIAAKKMKRLPPPPKSKKAEPAKPDEMVRNPRVESKARAILKRMQALQKIEDQGESENSPAPRVIKGNRISKGSSLSGEARETAQASYYDSLRDHLQQNWALAPWLARQDLAAQVQIFIDGRGRLHSFRFVRSSGNAQFDSAVKKAVMGSDPFPAPPAEIAESLLADGIIVGFPL